MKTKSIVDNAAKGDDESNVAKEVDDQMSEMEEERLLEITTNPYRNGKGLDPDTQEQIPQVKKKPQTNDANLSIVCSRNNLSKPQDLTKEEQVKIGKNTLV